MRPYRNAFRHRTSDQRGDDGQIKYLRSFASDVLDLLPPEPWDRLLVIRSAPGAGKTSLLRAFEPKTLKDVSSNPSDYPDFFERLLDAGAVDSQGSRILGIRISVRSYFSDIVDLQLPPVGARNLFLRFLDAQIMRGFLLALAELLDLSSPSDFNRIELRPETAHPGWEDRLGGIDGLALWRWAADTDSLIRRLLDSVLPIAIDSVDGHMTLYSLYALGGSDVLLDGVALNIRPAVMIDDGQGLHSTQRSALFDVLTSRDLIIGRWYTERHQALPPNEIIGDGEPSRQYEVLELERATRTMGGKIRGGRRIRAFDAMLLDVADRRAARPLFEYGDDSDTSFGEHLGQLGLVEAEQATIAQAISKTSQRVRSDADGSSRFNSWIAEIPHDHTLDTAIRWREVEILIARDRIRPQQALLDLSLTDDERKKRSSSALREAAWLFLNRESRVPYYFGSARLAQIGNHNFDQFLSLCAQLFDEMLAHLTLGRRGILSATAQETMVRKLSSETWAAIPQRRSYGRDIQRLLIRMATYAKNETYRATAPYAPGVSGVALSMRDRDRLLQRAVREYIPGANALFHALGGAIGHNLLDASVDMSSKGEQWMVLYINRLLCVRYRLPIGRGGWRPIELERMSGWLSDTPPTDLRGEVTHEQLLFDGDEME